MDDIAQVLNDQTARVLAQKACADRVLCNLTALLKKANIPGEIAFFGSFANGFNTGDSDFDVTLVTEEPDERGMLRKLAALHSAYEFINFTTILQAQVPIVKFADAKQGIEVDFSINNRLGIRNSELLRTYCTLHPRISPLGRLVKEWARRREIVGTVDGCLNAYAYMLMVIFFLQVGCDPPICGSLQSLASIESQDTSAQSCDENGNTTDHFGYTWDTRFLSDLDIIPASTNDDSLEKLLRDFFYFYTHVFDWNADAVCIRIGQLQKKQWLQCFQRHRDYGELWCVADPFDLRRNLAGKTSSEGRKRILDEMETALRHVEAGDISSVIRADKNMKTYYLKCRLTGNIIPDAIVQEFEPQCIQSMYFPDSLDRKRSPYAFLEFKSCEDRRVAFAKNESMIGSFQLQLHATVPAAVREALAASHYVAHHPKEKPVIISIAGDMDTADSYLNPQAVPFFPPSISSYAPEVKGPHDKNEQEAPREEYVLPFPYDDFYDDTLAYSRPPSGVIAQPISLAETVMREQRDDRHDEIARLKKELEELRARKVESSAPPKGFGWRVALFHTVIHAVPVLYDDDWEDILFDAMGNYVDTHVVPEGHNRAAAWGIVDKELHALLQEVKIAVNKKAQYLNQNVPSAKYFHNRTITAAAEVLAHMPSHITKATGGSEDVHKNDRTEGKSACGMECDERREFIARVDTLEREATQLRREKDALVDMVDAMKKCWNDLPVMMLPHLRAMMPNAPPEHEAETQAQVAKEMRDVLSTKTMESSMREFTLKCGTLSSIRQLLDAPFNKSEVEDGSNVHENALWGLNSTLLAAKSPVRSTSFGFNVHGIVEEVCACGLVEPVTRLMDQYAGNVAVQRQAVSAIANLMTSATDEQVCMMMENNPMAPLCSAMGAKDEEIISKAVEALVAILQAGSRSKENIYCKTLEDAGGIPHLNRLKNHNRVQIRMKALHALQFFAGEMSAPRSETEDNVEVDQPLTLLNSLGGANRGSDVNSQNAASSQDTPNRTSENSDKKCRLIDQEQPKPCAFFFHKADEDSSNFHQCNRQREKKPGSRGASSESNFDLPPQPVNPPPVVPSARVKPWSKSKSKLRSSKEKQARVTDRALVQ